MSHFTRFVLPHGILESRGLPAVWSHEVFPPKPRTTPSHECTYPAMTVPGSAAASPPFKIAESSFPRVSAGVFKFWTWPQPPRLEKIGWPGPGMLVHHSLVLLTPGRRRCCAARRTCCSTCHSTALAGSFPQTRPGLGRSPS